MTCPGQGGFHNTPPVGNYQVDIEVRTGRAFVSPLVGLSAVEEKMTEEYKFVGFNSDVALFAETAIALICSKDAWRVYLIDTSGRFLRR